MTAYLTSRISTTTTIYEHSRDIYDNLRYVTASIF